VADDSGNPFLFFTDTDSKTSFGASYDSETGNERWSFAVPSNAVAPSQIAGLEPNGDLIVASSLRCCSFSLFARIASADGSAVWSHDTRVATQGFTAVAVSATGDIAVGSSQGVDVGCGALTGPAFVSKHTPAGDCVWANAVGVNASASVEGVAIDANGEVAFAGSFSGQLTFGNEYLTSVGSTDVLVGKYSSDGTKLLWKRQFGYTGTESAYRIVALPNGDFLVAGVADESIDFGKGPVDQPGQKDLFLVQLHGEDGATVTSKGFGSAAGDDSIGMLSLGSDDTVTFPVTAGGPIDFSTFGGGTTAAAGTLYVKMKLP
jgi:hypothetical protein